MTVSEQLRDAYQRSGLTQEEIAHRAGVSEKTLWNALRGRNVEAGNLIAVAKVVGLDALRLS